MNKKLFRNLEIAGAPIIFLVASFLHFFFEITRESVLGALFGAVNESVWEHLKIFSIAYVFWGFVELVWIKPSIKRFVVVKTLGVYALCGAIAGFFYLYTGIVGESVFLVDILMSALFTVLAQVLSYRLYFSSLEFERYFYTAMMLLILAFCAVLCFSYYPPKKPLFRDPVTGLYGVPSKKLDRGAQVLSAVIGANE